MKNKISLIILILISVTIPAILISCRSRAQADPEGVSTLTHDGLTRTYRVYIPTDYDKNKATPLVFVLHGGGGSGKNMDKLTGFNIIAEREGFIVVYPDGIEEHWNDGREVENRVACEEKIDDVGFISALIDHLGEYLNIDRERVYATGISNGGLMSFRLAYELSEKIAAIAPVTANIGEDLYNNSSPGKPISVLVMNGTEDPLVPWGGGDIHFFNLKKLGKVISTEETIKFWVEHNKCSKDPEITELPDTEDDGTKVIKESYTGGTEGTEVILYKIEGGGHTWPGGWQYLGEKIIGKTCRDINGSEIIWEFFKRHKLNQ